MFYTILADHTGNRYVRQFHGGVKDLRNIFEQIYKIPVKDIYRISKEQYNFYKKG